jgi:hypothetical protein
MQVIYDSKGTIFMQGSGFSKPEGDLTYTEISIPENQYLVKMDTTKDPVEPIFAEYPKSEMQIMKETLEQQQADLDYLKLLSGDEEV